jgi:hypothetical protein
MEKGQWKRAAKRVPKLQTEGGFRLIRVFTPEHNVQRLSVYVARLAKRQGLAPGGLKWRLRMRRPKKCPAPGTATGYGAG